MLGRAIVRGSLRSRTREGNNRIQRITPEQRCHGRRSVICSHKPSRSMARRFDLPQDDGGAVVGPKGTTCSTWDERCLLLRVERTCLVSGDTSVLTPEQKSQTKTVRTSDGHQPTNPEVRSSNLFGRATSVQTGTPKDADFTLDAATSVRNSSVLEPTRLD